MNTKNILVVLALSVAGTAAWAESKIWVATADGNASVAANWDPNGVPGADDTIVLDGASSLRAMTWDAGVNGLPAQVAAWEQSSSYTGTVTFLTTYPDAVDNNFKVFTVSGDATLAGGKWTHPANADKEVWRLRMDIGGNLTIDGGAAIDCCLKGYAATNYPAGSQPGSHGGALDFCQQMRTLKGPHHIAQGLLVVIDQRQKKPFIPALRHPEIVPVFPVDRIFLRDAFIHAVFHDLHLCACELLQAVIAAIGKTGQPCRRLRIVSDDAVLMPVSVKVVDMPEVDKFPILRKLRLPLFAQRRGDILHRRPRFDGGVPAVKPKRKADKAGASDCADQHQDQYDERRRPGSFSHTFHPSSFHPLIAACPAAALTIPPVKKSQEKTMPDTRQSF